MSCFFFLLLRSHFSLFEVSQKAFSVSSTNVQKAQRDRRKKLDRSLCPASATLRRSGMQGKEFRSATVIGDTRNLCRWGREETSSSTSSRCHQGKGEQQAVCHKNAQAASTAAQSQSLPCGAISLFFPSVEGGGKCGS